MTFILRTSFACHFETPMPPTLTRAQIISALHNHTFMILRNTRVLSHKLLAPTDPKSLVHSNDRFHAASASEAASTVSDVHTYEVTDKMTFLPESIWPASSVTYTMSLQDTEEGLRMVLRAAMGLANRTVWSIKGEEEMVLEEDAQVEVNRLVAEMVRKNMHESAAPQGERFVKGIVEGTVGTVGKS